MPWIWQQSCLCSQYSAISHSLGLVQIGPASNSKFSCTFPTRPGRRFPVMAQDPLSPHGQAEGGPERHRWRAGSLHGAFLLRELARDGHPAALRAWAGAAHAAADAVAHALAAASSDPEGLFLLSFVLHSVAAVRVLQRARHVPPRAMDLPQGGHSSHAPVPAPAASPILVWRCGGACLQGGSVAVVPCDISVLVKGNWVLGYSLPMIG